MTRKVRIIILVILGVIAYTVISFWAIGTMRPGNLSLPFSSTQNSEAATPNVPQTTQRPTLIPRIPAQSASPIPTSAPLQGPGRYACDRDGICGDFSDQMRTYCPQTFADRNCLGMCGTPAIRCSQ